MQSFHKAYNMAHKLNIRVFSDVLNPQFIFVKDLSQWDEDLEVLNRKLHIVPFFTKEAIEVPFPKDDEIGFIGKDLGYGVSDTWAPDGYYSIKYSVSPNDLAFRVVHYYHTAKLNQMFMQRCRVLLHDLVEYDPCGNPKLEKNQKLVTNALLVVDGLSALCEEGRIAEANNLYAWAYNLISRIQNSDC
jgi:hypothetical protein